MNPPVEIQAIAPDTAANRRRFVSDERDPGARAAVAGRTLRPLTQRPGRSFIHWVHKPLDLTSRPFHTAHNRK